MQALQRPNHIYYNNAYNKQSIKRSGKFLPDLFMVVVSPGIEPGSGASETLILSIVLRDRGLQNKQIVAAITNTSIIQ